MHGSKQGQLRIYYNDMRVQGPAHEPAISDTLQRRDSDKRSVYGLFRCPLHAGPVCLPQMPSPVMKGETALGAWGVSRMQGHTCRLPLVGPAHVTLHVRNLADDRHRPLPSHVICERGCDAPLM